ncbi:MAG: hypothetical protein ACFFCF_12330 [Promethearchaeota archaeon]
MNVGLSLVDPPESKPNSLGIALMHHLGVLYQVESIVAAAAVEYRQKQSYQVAFHDSDNLGSSLVK